MCIRDRLFCDQRARIGVGASPAYETLGIRPADRHPEDAGGRGGAGGVLVAGASPAANRARFRGDITYDTGRTFSWSCVRSMSGTMSGSGVDDPNESVPERGAALMSACRKRD